MKIKDLFKIVNNSIDYAMARMISVKGYTALFKVSIICLTFYLSSMVTYGTIMLPIESEANQLLHNVEKEIGENLTFEELDCKIEMETYSECKMAIHNNNLSEASIYLLVKIQHFSFLFGSITLVLSIIGFFSYSFKAVEDNTESIKLNVLIRLEK